MFVPWAAGTPCEQIFLFICLLPKSYKESLRLKAVYPPLGEPRVQCKSQT